MYRYFPGDSAVKNLPSNAVDAGSIIGQGAKIPYVPGQLSPCAATAEPSCHNHSGTCCLTAIASCKPTVSESVLGAFQHCDFQLSSLAQLCPTLCDPMNRSTPGLPVHNQLPKFAQTDFILTKTLHKNKSPHLKMSHSSKMTELVNGTGGS